MTLEGDNSTYGDGGNVLLGTSTVSSTARGSVMVGGGCEDGGIGGSGLVGAVVFPGRW